MREVLNITDKNTSIHKYYVTFKTCITKYL